MLTRLLYGRVLLAYGHDLAVATLSFWAALYLRVGSDILIQLPSGLGEATLLFAAAAALAFLAAGVPFTSWRHVSLADVVAIGIGSAGAIFLFMLAMFLYVRLDGVPRTAMVMNWFILFVGLAGPRMLRRLLVEGQLGFWLKPEAGAERVLLVGGGRSADLFLRALRGRRHRPYSPVGIVDDGRWSAGGSLHGVPILGRRADLPALLERLERQGRQPAKLVLAASAPAGEEVRALLELAARHGMTLAKLPEPTLLEARPEAEAPPIRPVNLEDLLGRPPRALDRARMRELVAGRRVLVTGAGGSIGGELARQIAAFGPARLTLLDHGEFALYGIDMEIARAFPAVPRAALLADVRVAERVRQAVAEAAPDVVFHCAALKHVPIVEAHPVEGAWTNVLGTRNVADACLAAGVGAMVLISTDKAVDPANAMGATKRLAEMYCQGLDIESQQQRRPTRFVTVRFGNVLGSTGSVVPLFQQQLAAGGPLTVTHPDVTRYFMTVREAAELVLQATVLGAAAAGRGRIFVLDMGEPVRIADLARQMIRLAGLEPERDVAIRYVGLRPGEKVHEALFAAAEPTLETPVPGVLTAQPRTADPKLLTRAFIDLEAACRAGDAERVLALLHRLVPEYAAAFAAPAEAGGRS